MTNINEMLIEGITEKCDIFSFKNNGTGRIIFQNIGIFHELDNPEFKDREIDIDINNPRKDHSKVTIIKTIGEIMKQRYPRLIELDGAMMSIMGVSVRTRDTVIVNVHWTVRN